MRKSPSARIMTSKLSPGQRTISFLLVDQSPPGGRGLIYMGLGLKSNRIEALHCSANRIFP